MTSHRSAALVAFCVFLSSACGGSVAYWPQEPGRIHFVKNDGKVRLERDGKLYSTSGWGKDPIEAVSGNPAAEAQARSYVKKTWSTVILGAVGLALIVPVGVLATNEPGHSDRKIASISLAATAMVAFITAACMPLWARHHLYDAVNIYNDDLATGKASGLPDSQRDTSGVGVPVERPPDGAGR